MLSVERALCVTTWEIACLKYTHSNKWAGQRLPLEKAVSHTKKKTDKTVSVWLHATQPIYGEGVHVFSTWLHLDTCEHTLEQEVDFLCQTDFIERTPNFGFGKYKCERRIDCR
jgi:hypothetical protein